MKASGAAFFFAAAALVGCGGALSAPDGGSGTGGTGGTSFDASGIPPELRFEFNNAVAAWAAAKSSCAIYSYDRRWMSVFGGGGSTKVEVRNDRATRRLYSTATPGDGGIGAGAWMTVWDEMGSDVGSHPTSWDVFPAATVEQLLAECAMVLALDPAQYTISFLAERHGAPTTCTYYPIGCADDCLGGITIVDFACAPLAN